MSDKLFEDCLVRFYGEQPRAVDDLPYTEELEHMLMKLDREPILCSPSRRDVYLALMRLRKAGRLPRKRGPVGPTGQGRGNQQETLF